MTYYNAKMGNLVIASSGTTTPERTAKADYGDAENIVIFAPATLTGTVTVEVSDVPGGTFVPLQSGGADVTLPAGKATTITEVGFPAMRFKSGSAEAAARTFILSKQFKIA